MKKLCVQAILRPVSMMVPDFTLIAEIMMFSEGFSSAKVLAKKMIAIMELSQQQLSKQVRAKHKSCHSRNF